MLSCSWEGGFPRAFMWWISSSGEMQGATELDTSTLVLRSSANYSGKTFVCHAKHPIAKESKQCSLKLGKTCFILSYLGENWFITLYHSIVQFFNLICQKGFVLNQFPGL